MKIVVAQKNVNKGESVMGDVKGEMCQVPWKGRGRGCSGIPLTETRAIALLANNLIFYKFHYYNAYGANKYQAYMPCPAGFKWR